MKSLKRNRPMKAKQQRRRAEREIEALAKQGKTAAALRVAMGGNKFAEDSARQIVGSWRAVIELERHPELLPEDPPNFYQHVLNWAKNQTWTAMHRVIKEGNEHGEAEAFFLRMAREVARPSQPDRDNLRAAILANRLICDKAGNNAGKSVKCAKEIASDLPTRYKNPESGARVVRRATARMRPQGADK